MNKGNLIKAIVRKSGVSRTEVSRTLDAYQEVIGETLARGEEIRVTGFMRIRPVHRPGRTSRNPQTGDQMHIPDKRIVKVTVGKTIKDAIQDLS